MQRFPEEKHKIVINNIGTFLLEDGLFITWNASRLLVPYSTNIQRQKVKNKSDTETNQNKPHKSSPQCPCTLAAPLRATNQQDKHQCVMMLPWQCWSPWLRCFEWFLQCSCQKMGWHRMNTWQEHSPSLFVPSVNLPVPHSSVKPTANVSISNYMYYLSQYSRHSMTDEREPFYNVSGKREEGEESIQYLK